jgi:hypothetical protein
MKRSPSIDALIEHYRQAEKPTASARERVLERLAQRTASGELPGFEAPAPPLLPVAATWSAALKLSIGGGRVLAAALAWYGAAALTPEPEPTHERVAGLPDRAGAREAAAAEPVVAAAREAAAEPPAAAPKRLARPPRMPRATRPAKESAPIAAPRQAPIPTPTAPAPTPTRAHDSEAAARTAVAAVPTAAATADRRPERAPPAAAPDLEQELALIRSAYEALRAGRPERALAQLAEHSWRYPRSELAASREVARIMALCAAGKTDTARQEARRFLQRSPGSPYAARVRSLCGGVDGAP